VDGDALLRLWLTQQHELGDRELILPSLTSQEATRLMRGAPIGPESAKRPAASRSGARTTSAPRAESRPPDTPPNALSAPPPDAPRTTPPEGADWRTELSAAGAAPRASRGRRADAPDAPSRDRDTGPAAPLAPAPDTSTADTIAALAGLIAQCRACSLYRTAQNPVPGEGNPNADFVCVGEAPGANEDEQGRPFVGQAGQLLTKILAAVNLEREDVFIMNVLKHRPPGNRNPDPAEVAACRPFLLRQLELIQPKVILALGTFAAQTLLDTKETLGKLRGRVHSFQGIPVVVTYHPAALLRNSAWKRPTWEDVQLARRILDGSGPGA
jgi:DNA polymerase